jgi:hypothetical protein
MERKGALVVAVVAAVVNLVVIAATGNQWYYDHVAIKSSSNGANATIKQVPVAFRWRLSHWSGDHNLRLGEVIASASVVILVFLLTWVVSRSQRRPRGFFGPFFAIWGLEMLSAVVASMVGTFISYPGLFGSRANPLGTTRFWWSVIEGPAAQVIMWALCVGFIAALLCALITMGQKAEPFDEPGRPEDAFFPPRTPDLSAPPAAAVAAGADNPELAGYGWTRRRPPQMGPRPRAGPHIRTPRRGAGGRGRPDSSPPRPHRQSLSRARAQLGLLPSPHPTGRPSGIRGCLRRNPRAPRHRVVRRVAVFGSGPGSPASPLAGILRRPGR